MKKVLKIIGIVLGSLVGLIVLAAAALYFVGTSRLNRTFDYPPSNLTIPTDEASLTNGKHFVDTLCAGCHGQDLSGVENWFNAGPIGTIDSANLTSGEGGVGQTFTDEDFVRAIRHGVDPEGKAIFMPAVVSTAHLSDEDLADIIAYIKSVPPVDHKTNGHHFGPVGRIMYAAGMLGNFPVDDVSHDVHVTAPAPGVTVEYGEYLVNTHDCHVCHGPNLNGGPFPDPTINVITPNITPGGDLSAWTEEDFINTIRTGTTPHGQALNPELMPWKDYSLLYDDELKAIWMYLQSVPAMDQYKK